MTESFAYRWLFWSDWGAVPKIERAGMDGSHRQVIVEHDIKWPNGLTLDIVGKRLFWVDAKLQTISSCNFDGSHRRVVLYSDEYLSHPFSITTFEDFVYWTDWTKHAVFRANKFNGSSVEAITAVHTVSLTCCFTIIDAGCLVHIALTLFTLSRCKIPWLFTSTTPTDNQMVKISALQSTATAHTYAYHHRL